MGLNVAIQMDPPETLNIKKDSTFLLGLEAQKRGHSLSYYHPSTMALQDSKLTAHCSPLKFHRKLGAHFTLGEGKFTDLTDFDLILMRQDFTNPQAYNMSTHLLDHVTNKTLVLNNPTGVRESPEKILITHYPELAPPTMITRSLPAIRKFQEQHSDIILKPVNGFGGLDVYHLKPGDDNLSSVYEMLTRLHPDYIVAQKYLPEIREGDKRIIVVEGEPVAAMMRVPAKNSARANLHVGGTAVKCDVTKRDREICEKLKPELVKRGLVFVGLDVIGGFVTEINPKSPTGLQSIYALHDGLKTEINIWDAFEKRYNAFKSKRT